MKTRVRLLALLALGSFLLCTVGCLEEKDTLTVYPSGAGTIHLYTKYGEQMSGMVTGFAEKGKEKEAVEAPFYKELARWHGVSAWSPVSMSLVNGLITYEATGYFEHVADLKKIYEENIESFAWTADPTGG